MIDIGVWVVGDGGRLGLVALLALGQATVIWLDLSVTVVPAVSIKAWEQPVGLRDRSVGTWR